jgi:hypothetical protein
MASWSAYYDSEETYFREVLGLASWRTAYKRLAIGRMLISFNEAERAVMCPALAEVGVAKASIVAPAIERLGQWRTWLTWALQLPAVALQEKVSQALQALPRGLEPSPPGTRFRQMVLAAMPDLEAMELVDRFFEVGTLVVGTDHAVAIFLAGCRECLPEWEIQVTRHLLEVTDGQTSAGTPDPERLTVTEWLCRTRGVCPRGQTRDSPPTDHNGHPPA